MLKHKITQEEKFQMMTTAPIPSLIGKMAIPTIISMLITSIYNIADTFFVSRLGTSATASVGIVFPIMAIIQAVSYTHLVCFFCHTFIHISPFCIFTFSKMCIRDSSNTRRL